MLLRVREEHAARVRSRLVLTALGVTAAVTAVLVVHFAAAPTARWLLYVGVVAALGWVGRPAGQALIDHAVTPTRVERLTDRTVVRALGALGLAGINQALGGKDGSDGRGWFPRPICRDGEGWRADVDLPHGVTAAEVAERREKLASGLRRSVGSVWPEPDRDAHAGRLVLWVGDQDMSKAVQKPWPLAKAGRADLFGPVPFGTDQRGRIVTVQLMFTNVLIGALPGAGKTFALRVLLLAAALDPTAELRVFELKGTGDLEPLAKVCRHYASGVDDETLSAAMNSLREVHGELERRAEVIKAQPKAVCPENKVTRALADRPGLGLHPLVLAIDECQELFTHEDYGKEAEKLAVAIIKRGRALGILLWLATQRPDAKSLPTGVSANVGTRFCMRVMGQLENDMILGTSMYKAGHRATMLTDADLGIGYLAAGGQPRVVRSAYLNGPAAERITVRARVLREDRGA